MRWRGFETMEPRVATIHVESIYRVSGKKLYGATVDRNLSRSKLANLVKLAEKL